MLALIAVLAGLLAQPPQRIVDIQVHGNALASDQEIIQIAGLSIGMAVDANTFTEAAERLRQSKKFEGVEVLKRFASIADPSQISAVIVVDEGPVTIQSDGSVKAGPDSPPGVVRVVRRRGGGVMFLPLLKYEDGYGLSYGVRFSMPDALGKGNRVSFPATWGGDKRAGVEFERDKAAVFSRIQLGVDFARRENPFLHENDDRGRTWVRAERRLARPLRIGGTGEWQRVSFGDIGDRFFRLGGDVTLDTRVDPLLARNAIYARAGWSRLLFRDATDASQADVDLRGYLGLIGQTVLMIRGQLQDSTHPLPPYLSPLLGGADSVRGFKAASWVGDTLVGASAELRVPITSPLSFGRAGLSAFLDTARVYNKGQHVRDQRFHRGVGGGIWFSAPFVRLDVYVAHGLGGSTRAHVAVATSVSF